jgi:ribosomal protein L11 methyltransferase
MSLYHIVFPSPKDQALAVMELFEDALSASGFEETDTGAWYGEVHFETEAEARAGAALAKKTFGAQATVAPLPDLDWVEKSLENLPAVAAGRFLIYGSHIDVTPRPGQIALRIDAGQAFGTGHHETTRGCLIALADHVKKSRPTRVLDLGCGTAILAVGLAKLVPAAILATDIDPVAVEVARDVAKDNGVRNRLRFAVGPGFLAPEIAAEAPFDLIIANILARPLVSLAPQMAANLMLGGTVVLSGLLIEQETRVLSAYLTQGLRFERRIHLDEWSTLVLKL